MYRTTFVLDNMTVSHVRYQIDNTIVNTEINGFF